jgi:peroxiredoxin
MTHAFLILVISLFIFPAIGEAKGSIGVGQVIPHDLTLQDSNGAFQNFERLTGKKGMVLVFIRSADWCPFCQKQLIELNERVSDFTKQGYKIVSISYDNVSSLQKFTIKNKPEITLLSDPRSEAIRAFGIMNEAAAKGTRSYGIPYPGVYIIDKNKKVQAKFFREGYKDRPSTNEILAKVKKLNPKPKYVAPPMTIKEMGEDPISSEEMFIDTPAKIEGPILLPNNIAPDDMDFDSVPDATLNSESSVTPDETSELTLPPVKTEATIGTPDVLSVPSTSAGTIILFTTP